MNSNDLLVPKWEVRRLPFKMAEWEFSAPKWCKFSNCGLYKVPAGESEKDYHYHDCDEYLIVTEGRGIVLLEDREYEIGVGDCVCIPIYGRHQVLKSLEDLVLVWIYDEVKGKIRKGHIPSTEGDRCTLPVKLVKLGNWLEEKPSWSRLAALGILTFTKGKVEMDYHYHDCHEYYFVTKGSLLIQVEGGEYEIREGEVCPIRVGFRHKVLEAYEDSTLIWLEEELLRQKRFGHLHYEDEKILPISELPYRTVLPKTNEYGIGVIGVGRIANQRQIPDYIKAGLKVVAICDINKEQLEYTRRRFGIEKTYTDYRQLLELKEVKVVDILTQSWVRAPIVRDTAVAGKHIICEKPFARTIEETRSLIKSAEDAGVKIAVHQPTRWYYPFALAKLLVQRGYIGEPYYYIEDKCLNYDGVYYEIVGNRWHIHLDDFLIIEWGAHPFDVSRWLFNQEPVSVYWSGTKMPYQNFRSEMAGSCLADFTSPLKAVFLLYAADQSGEDYWRFRIEGTEGSIKADGTRWLSICSRKLGTGWQRIEWDYRESVDEANGGPMYELINAIHEGREPSNSAQDNLNSVQFYLAVLKSSRERRIVNLDEIK